MSDRSRDDASRFVEEYPDQKFLEFVADADHPTTGDVADGIGCSHTTAYERLHELADADELTKRKIGNANVWMFSG